MESLPEETMETPMQPRTGGIGTTVNGHVVRARSRLSDRLGEEGDADTLDADPHPPQTAAIGANRFGRIGSIGVGEIDDGDAAWKAITTTAGRLSKGNMVRRPGNSVTLLNSMFHITRDAPLACGI